MVAVVVMPAKPAGMAVRQRVAEIAVQAAAAAAVGMPVRTEEMVGKALRVGQMGPVAAAVAVEPRAKQAAGAAIAVADNIPAAAVLAAAVRVQAARLAARAPAIRV